MFLLFIPLVMFVVGVLFLFPKRGGTKGRRDFAYSFITMAMFFTVLILFINYVDTHAVNKHYNKGVVIVVGSCRSADGFFSGNPGCTTIIKMENGDTRSAFVYDGAVKGMTVYQPCEEHQCDRAWSDGRTLSEGHWKSRKQ